MIPFLVSLPPSLQSEDQSSIFMMREQQLKNLAELAMPDPLDDESSSQLVEFEDSQPSSPKTDMFNFYQGFSPSMDDNPVLSTPSSKVKRLDKHSSRHLLYASHLPVAPSKLSRQERVVVLCGTGNTRLKVEALINEITTQAKAIYTELSQDTSLVLPASTNEFMSQFRMLPNFNQNEIATLCMDTLANNLTDSGREFSGYPTSSQLVFVCDLLEMAGSFRKLVDLLVELVSFTGVGDRKEDKRLTSRLPLRLCLPIVNLLWYYFPILLLSISDTAYVYEGLVCSM